MGQESFCMKEESPSMFLNIKSISFYIGIKFKYYYKLAVLVIALYGHSCLCFITCEAEPRMADP